MGADNDPTNYRRVAEKIRKMFQDGPVEWWEHAEKRMRERKITAVHVEHIIRYGQIVEHSKPGRYWRYAILGTLFTETPRREVKVVIEIRGKLIIVTVIDRVVR